MTKGLRRIASNKSFNGLVERYSHRSQVNDCDMTFSIFLPPQAIAGQHVPVLYWLSGLTCTDENFMQKAGAQRRAAELGLALVTPDTSPRGDDVPDDPNGHWDFGLGAGFYVDATESPWVKHYHMYTYVCEELPALIENCFPVSQLRSICGHSMGGHGALICALKNPGRYQSVSAFAPIVNPCQCPWGEKAFRHFLGSDREKWRAYDSCELIKDGAAQLPVLIDQGTADEFFTEQLKLENLSSVTKQSGFQAQINLREDYDHSYYFIASFIDQHLNFHAAQLIMPIEL